MPGIPAFLLIHECTVSYLIKNGKKRVASVCDDKSFGVFFSQTELKYF